MRKDEERGNGGAGPRRTRNARFSDPDASPGVSRPNVVGANGFGDESEGSDSMPDAEKGNVQGGSSIPDREDVSAFEKGSEPEV